MAKILTGKALVENQLMKLSPGVKELVKEAYLKSETGAMRFSRQVKWTIEPRVHISKLGHVTLRFIDIGVSMTAFIFLDQGTVDYRASIEREGVDFAPYCQGIDLQTNALRIVKAFGVDVFSH